MRCLIDLRRQSLESAQLQGASLTGARLQGALLDFAELQGALLDEAQLQGAWLYGAELQGASLDGALLQVVSLRRSVLWRAAFETSRFDRLTAQGASWIAERSGASEPTPWTHRSFLDLRTLIRRDVPEGRSRDAALERIARLDPDDGDWLDYAWPLRAMPIFAAKVDDDAYREALADTLKTLVCTSGEDAVFILRGLMRGERLDGLAGFGPDWVKAVEACSIAGLNDQDRARLRAWATPAKPPPK